MHVYAAVHCQLNILNQAMCAYLGSRWLPCKLTQLLAQDFLLLDVDILISKEHNSALRNYIQIRGKSTKV
jgi:hypothetical protein